MMKKSQILAAIALAFALGVVAPVAGASALTLEEKDGTNIKVHGKATCAEARTAVKYIEENTQYKNLLGFYNAAAKAYAIQGDSFSDPTEDETSVIIITTSELKEMVKTVGSAFHNAALDNTKTTKAYKDALAKITLGNVEDFLKSVKTDGDGYAAYRGIYDAIEANDGKGNYTAFKAAVKVYNDKYTGEDLASNEDNFNKIVNGDVAHVYGGANFRGNYAKFVTLFEYMDRADDEIKGYKDAKKLILDAYKVLDDNEQINAAGKAAYKKAVTDADWVYLDEVIDIVMNSDTLQKEADHYYDNVKINGNNVRALTVMGGYGIMANAAGNSNVYNAAAWNNVTDEIANVLTCTKYTQEDKVYGALKALAEVYRGTLREDISLNDLIKKMVNYEPKTPVVVPDDSTNPADAPNSGILGTADNSASATISIVAGLATALAALGAGVVAFRSARRSK